MEEKVTLSLLQDADIKGKIVLVRVDHNVVKKGKINDPYRIDATVATLFHIVSRGGRLILMTHVGRPKDKKSGEIKISDESSIKAVAKYLENKLGIKVKTPEFTATPKGYTTIDSGIQPLIHELKDGKIGAIYLPNTRWFAGEEAKDQSADEFAKQLAGLADIYVNDAFGSWQAHASTVRVNNYLPSYTGLLMQKEIENLNRIFNPGRPFLAVVAGSKFDTKIESLSALLKRADYLLLGGVIYNAYLCAKYGVKIKGIEEEDLIQAKKFAEFAAGYPGKLIELPYIVESETMEGRIEGKYNVMDTRKLKPGMELNYVLDAAKESFSEENIKNIFMQAKTIFINAVMGFTPHFTEGTIAMDLLIDKNKEASKLYGGGDTLEEMKKLLPGVYMKALDDPNYYLFTGGGAVLKAIEESSVLGMEPVKALVKK